nr:hypothetical protein [Tanacetum cinerariifolium]
IVIQQRVEDLQIGVKSYQKKLNLTKPDTYRSDLKSKEAYTAYSNPRGFIYQNKDGQNRLMQIDELHKFNNGTLNDVRTALDDHLKDSYHVPSDAMHNPSQPLKVRTTLFQDSGRYTYFYRLSHSELVGIEKEALSSSLRLLN